MNTPTTYEIVIKGRASARLLRPLLDDFAIDHDLDGVTRLIGDVRDASHLHGIVAHLTSVGIELISLGPATPTARPALSRPDQHVAWCRGEGPVLPLDPIDLVRGARIARPAKRRARCF